MTPYDDLLATQSRLAPTPLPGPALPTLRTDDLRRTIAAQLAAALDGSWLIACTMAVDADRTGTGGPRTANPPPPVDHYRRPVADVAVAARRPDHLPQTRLLPPGDIRLIVHIEDPRATCADRDTDRSVWAATGIPYYLCVIADGDDLWLDYHQLQPNGRYHLIVEGDWRARLTTPWPVTLDLNGC